MNIITRVENFVFKIKNKGENNMKIENLREAAELHDEVLELRKARELLKRDTGHIKAFEHYGPSSYFSTLHNKRFKEAVLREIDERMKEIVEHLENL